MRSDRARCRLKRLAAIGGLLFLHLPILLIFLYAFTTEERVYQFPPPGPDDAMVRRGLVGPARHLAAAAGCR
jgi:ABC-type spermidine/putrescine transport system permease subunit II